METFILIHLLRHIGPGAVNRDGNGLIKTIMVGGERRMRISQQKIKYDIKEFIKRLQCLPISEQTRALVDWTIHELTLLNIDQKKAKEWAQALINNFLKHNKDDKDEKKTEVTRIFPEELKELENAIKALASGQIDDPSNVNFMHVGIAFDIALSGRMRPTFIAGAVSVGEAVGIERFEEEKDYFIAIEGWKTKSFYKKEQQASAHLGERSLGSSTVYQNFQINVPLLIKNLNNNLELVQEVLVRLLDTIYFAGAASNSTGGAHTHTFPSYIMIEKLSSEPRSLEPAFERAVISLAEGVDRLRTLKACYDKEVPAESIEFSCYFNESGNVSSKGSLAELKKFICDSIKQ